MPEEITRSGRGRPAADEQVLAQARADRRRRVGWALAGLAIVLVLLANVVAGRSGAGRSQDEDLRREQPRRQAAQECITAGNAWIDGQGCLIIQQGAPAPRAS